MEEDMRVLGAQEQDALDRFKWRDLIKHLTLLEELTLQKGLSKKISPMVCQYLLFLSSIIGFYNIIIKNHKPMVL